MTQYHVAVVDGFHRVYATEDGISRTFIGPRHATPKEAAAWADMIAANDPATRRADDAGDAHRSSGSPDLSPPGQDRD